MSRVTQADLPLTLRALRKMRSGTANIRELASRRPGWIATTCSWIGVGIVSIVVLGLVIFALAPRLWGWQFVTVSGGSMEPTFAFGSLAVMGPVNADSLEAGDIVMFRDTREPARRVTHRVVEVSPDGQWLTTRGDANSAPDLDPVPIANVEARFLFAVPWVGNFSTWMQTRWGYFAMIVGPGLLIIANEINSIVKTVRHARAAKVQPVEAAES